MLPHKYEINTTVYKKWKKGTEQGYYPATIIERKRKHKTQVGKWYLVKWEDEAWKEVPPTWTREHLLKTWEEVQLIA